jgi:hypothetical protein
MAKPTKTLDALGTLGAGAFLLYPNLAPFAPGLNQALKLVQDDIQKPETLRAYKDTVLALMAIIPAATPFVGLASIVMDIIIFSIIAEQQNKDK